MSKEELDSLLESIKVRFNKQNLTNSDINSPKIASISEFELKLFKYFLENNIDTIYILYTNVIFQPPIYMGLCISFSDEMSYNLFENKWGKWISDTSCLLKKIKRDKNTGKCTSITVIIYGNSLYNLGSLLESEIETKIINKLY